MNLSLLNNLLSSDAGTAGIETDTCEEGRETGREPIQEQIQKYIAM